MKKRFEMKGFMLGFVSGILIISGGTYAAVTGAGTLGSLFMK